MDIKDILEHTICSTLTSIFNQSFNEDALIINETRKEFEGDYTLVCFPFSKLFRKAPPVIAEDIGQALIKTEIFNSYNVVSGFLNLKLSNHIWNKCLNHYSLNSIVEKNKATYVVEYSSPNTNKPLHLGHIRNNLLGKAVCNLLKSVGHNVVETNLVNDRGIHICKSMLAWKKYGSNETPESSQLKGDHLVGKYYVKFDQIYKEQIQKGIQNGQTEKEAKELAPIMKEARSMLIKWEAGDKEVRALWEQMNNWVYKGFDETYKRLGISFDKTMYESETYKLGKKAVLAALKKNQCYQKEDQSIWIDLKEKGLDDKILLRSDGTSVYITQDIGTAMLRHEEYKMDHSVYVVGNEQEYHFNVLKESLVQFGQNWANGIHHLSYGMVDLPSGKMKSREGTVVDADDLLQEMHETAKSQTLELGKIDAFTSEEANELFEVIGLGALKFFLLKVDPKKRILFNPEESIDFQGFTGPFIQYTHARICSMLSKANDICMKENIKLGEQEITLCIQLFNYKECLLEAASQMNPAIIANYCFDLSKSFNRYYAAVPILSEENEELRNMRLFLCEKITYTLKTGMALLGIKLPNKM